MDIGAAFSYMFDDENWVMKLAIGGGIMLVGIPLSCILIGLPLLFLVFGYQLQLLKNVRDGYENPLPEWTDFGDLFVKGAMVFLIGIVYLIPYFILFCGSMGTQFMAASPDLVGSDVSQMMGLVGACLSCVGFLVQIFCYVLIPSALIHYAQQDSIGAAFNIGRVFGFITSNIGDYLIVLLLGLAAGIVASFGMIACGIGLFFTLFWSYLVMGNLYGQLAQKANGGFNDEFAPI